MSSAEENSKDLDDRLDELIAHCYEEMEAGNPLDREAIFKAYPEYESALRDFFADVSFMGKVVPEAPESTASESLEPTSEFVESTAAVQEFKSARLGPYDVLQRVGSSANGVVLRALHRNLHRVVAIRFFRHGFWPSDQELVRFKEESRTLSDLCHPGIVDVLEFGVHRGRHYCVMEHVEGGSLQSLVQQGPVSPVLAAQLVHQIAMAIQAAHEKGISHGALSLDAVLLAQDGTPRVSRFGLPIRTMGHDESSKEAESTDAHSPGTRSQGVVGSAEEGSSVKRSCSDDIYGLGLLLLELLVGRVPKRYETRSKGLGAGWNRNPSSIRRWVPAVPSELEIICVKCLQLNPADRFAKAQEVADELLRFLQRRPILTQPVRRVEQLRRLSLRTARTRPFIFAAASVVVLVSLIFGRSLIDSIWPKTVSESAMASNDRSESAGLASTNYGNAAATDSQRSRDEAANSVVETPSRENSTIDSLSEPPPDIADPVEVPDLSTAPSDVAATGSDEPGADEVVTEAPGFEWHYANRLALRPTTIETPGFKHSVLAVHPTGDFVATGGPDGIVSLWDWRKAEAKAHFEGHGAAISAIAFDSTGRRLVTGSLDQRIIIWDLQQERRLKVLRGHAGAISSVAFSPDGTLVASSSADGTVRLWSTETGRPLQLLGDSRERESLNGRLAFGFRGALLVHAVGNTIECWDVAPTVMKDRCQLKFQRTLSSPIVDLECDPLGTMAFVASASPGAIIALNVGFDGGVEFGDFGAAVSLSYAPDGSRLIALESSGVYKRVSPASRLPVEPLYEQHEEVLDMACGPQGTGVFSIARDQEAIVVLQAEDHFPITIENTLPFRTNPIWCGDGESFATLQSNLGLAIRNLDSPNEPADGSSIPIETDFTQVRDTALAASPNGRYLAVAMGEQHRSIGIYDADSRQRVRTLDGHFGAVTAIAFQHGPHVVATASLDGSINFWKYGTGELLEHSIELLQYYIEDMEFSPDGQWLGAACSDRKFRFWNTEDWSIAYEVNREDQAKQVDFSLKPDVAICAFDKRIVWVNLRKRSERTLIDRPRSIRGIALSTDGNRLAEVGHENGSVGIESIRIWNTNEATECLRIASPISLVTGVMFSPDSRALIAISEGGLICVWDCRLSDEAEEGLGSSTSGDAEPPSEISRGG